MMVLTTIYKLLIGPNGEETVDHHLARMIVIKEKLTNELHELMKELSIDILHSFD